jgi:hypothetical protein
VYGTASVGPPAGGPDSPPPGVGNPRYVYLLSRLRNRQITMEEATELFSLQQQMIAGALAAARSASASAAAAGAAPGSPPSTAPAGTPAPVAFNDEGLALSLLAMGAGAGVLAAVLKRAQEGPRRPPA